MLVRTSLDECCMCIIIHSYCRLVGIQQSQCLSKSWTRIKISALVNFIGELITQSPCLSYCFCLHREAAAAAVELITHPIGTRWVAGQLWAPRTLTWANIRTRRITASAVITGAEVDTTADGDYGGTLATCRPLWCPRRRSAASSPSQLFWWRPHLLWSSRFFRSLD